MEQVDLGTDVRRPQVSPSICCSSKEKCVGATRQACVTPSRGKSFFTIVFEKPEFLLNKGASLSRFIGQGDGTRPKRLIGLHNDMR